MENERLESALDWRKENDLESIRLKRFNLKKFNREQKKKRLKKKRRKFYLEIAEKHIQS